MAQQTLIFISPPDGKEEDYISVFRFHFWSSWAPDLTGQILPFIHFPSRWGDLPLENTYGYPKGWVEMEGYAPDFGEGDEVWLHFVWSQDKGRFSFVNTYRMRVKFCRRFVYNHTRIRFFLTPILEGEISKDLGYSPSAILGGQPLASDSGVLNLHSFSVRKTLFWMKNEEIQEISFRFPWEVFDATEHFVEILRTDEILPSFGADLQWLEILPLQWKVPRWHLYNGERICPPDEDFWIASCVIKSPNVVSVLTPGRYGILWQSRKKKDEAKVELLAFVPFSILLYQTKAPIGNPVDWAWLIGMARKEKEITPDIEEISEIPYSLPGSSIR